MNTKHKLHQLVVWKLLGAEVLTTISAIKIDREDKEMYRIPCCDRWIEPRELTCL
jgi:hypothetical protein